MTMSQIPVKSNFTPPQDFLWLNHHFDAQRTEHIRMQQTYLGFPVWGGYAVFHRKHRSGAKSALSVNGSIYQKLYEDLGTCPSEFVAHAKKILQTYCQLFPEKQILERSIQPMVYIDDHDKAHWAYQIQVYLQPSDTLPRKPIVIIAEKTGKILLEWDALTTLRRAVHGLGFGGNRRSGKYQYGKERPYLDLYRDEQSGACTLENERVRVVDMHHRIVRPNHPMSFPCTETNPANLYWTGYHNDGYDQANGSYSVSNDAMYFGEMLKKMYRTEYGVEVLKQGSLPMQIIFRVHYSNYFADAFWDGRQMTFGDGDNELHAPVTLGITAHELAHGFTEQHSGLIYYGQTGGINEAFSDMASQAAEYYVYGKASWQMGAEVIKTASALRWFQHPSRDGVSIERASDYRDGMDVHYSSGVYNYFFYLLANRPGWDPLKAFHVILKANMDYWTPTINFSEAACGILAANRDLGFSEEDVKDSLMEVEIDYRRCIFI